MHSRIYEIRKERFQSMDEYYSFDWENLEDMPSSVDYVVESDDREGDIEWLREFMSKFEGIIFDEKSFIIAPKFKEEFFKERLKKLKEEVSALTITQFSEMDEGLMEIYDIQRQIEDPLGFRVFNYELGNVSLDTFIREMEPNVRYHIGGVGDYHF